ncbi:MAG: DeoR/GlpR family DNA-binding transcription regulator [Lactobacillales bacterium]|jgi:DeoR family lactose phosphotransferase system repressor|nr:DeoR/GlpR family DNA-binding transcription regulator [Lactobacillales bacterium]
MLKTERQERIVSLINEQEFLNVNQIAELLNVTPMTIRRDVNELAEKNKLIRVYGGAQKISLKDREYSTQEKMCWNEENKQYIGNVMNQLIKEGDTIYLGAGTTILHALKNITKKELLIVTNSLIAFQYVQENTDYKVILTGGEYAEVTEEFTGEITEKAFTPLNIDIAFAATNGIYGNNITTSSSNQGRVQREAFAHSKVKAIVADHSKFNVSDVYTFYHLTDIDYVVTDNGISETLLNQYESFVKIKYQEETE